MHKNVVHVVGTGTIGEPLIGLMANFQEQLGIDEITFHKRTPLLTDRSKVAALTDTIALGPEKEDNLEEGKFVCMRRANDLSEESQFLPAPEVGKHDDKTFGTHQGRDAHHLFKTLGLDLKIFSSALKLNTQYMHTIHFDMMLRRPTALKDVLHRLQSNIKIALTSKKSSASVFSFGRDHGLFGRILNQTVIVRQSLALRGDREVIGMCFTPQDGNSLLSSIAATLWFLDPDSYKRKLSAVLGSCFFSEI